MANSLVDTSETWVNDFRLTQLEHSTEAKIYDKNTFSKLEMFQTLDGLKVKDYFEQFIHNGSHPFFENIHANLSLIHVGNNLLPLLVPEPNQNNSYVCTPTGHYFLLPMELLFLIENRMAKIAAKLFFRSFGWLLEKCEINRIIYVNHWLFSTDLYPEGFSEKHIKEVTDLLVSHYPDHAIAFRSINDSTTKQIKNGLEKLGYSAVASRQVYISTPCDPAVHETRIIKSDLKLLRENPYEVVDGRNFTDEEFKMVLDLHVKFTVNHHSKYNPKITEKLLRTMIAKSSLHILALRKNGIIDGVVGYLERNGIMTCPLFGYDITLPEKTKIYRLLSTILFTEAKKKNLIFHQSAGASFYKTVRRSTPHMEYMYVYTKHLKKSQSLGWKALQATINTIAVPFMKKY